MIRAVFFTVAFLPIQAAAGSLVPIIKNNNSSTGSPGIMSELSLDAQTFSLQSHAPATPLVELNAEEGLDGKSRASGIEGAAITSGLNSDAQTFSLQGRAPTIPLVGLNAEEGLDGKSRASGIEGFLNASPPRLPAPLKLEDPIPEPVSFELRNLLFAYDSDVLAQTEKPVIAELNNIIIQTSPKSITLIGHTDRRGTSDYNLPLSKRRAHAVRKALIEWHGHDSKIFQIAGRGAKEPVSDGLTEADHARDRRVVVILNY